MVNLCAGGTFKQINGEMWPTEQIKSKNTVLLLHT